MDIKEQKMSILNSAIDYIPNLIQGIKEIIDNNQSGNEHKFLEMMPSAVEGIDWVVNAIELTKDINKQSLDIESLNNILSEMLEGVENQDYILVSDILEYEIIPKLIEWQDCLTKVLVNN